MTKAVVALGSNIDPAFNIPAALEMIEATGAIDLVATSATYESKAVGGDYPPFHNAAVLVETHLTPEELRNVLRRIEDALGRVRTEDKNAPRTIDLDITIFGDHRMPDLNIPDPEIEAYPFVAVPAAEVAGEMKVPGRNKTLDEIAETMSGTGLRKVKMPAAEKMSNGDHALSPDEAFEEYGPFDESFNPQFEKLVREQLEILGEDPNREGLVRTPYRVAKAMAYLTRGYTQSLKEVVNNAIFESDTQDMVMLKDIEFYSMCEHHLLPFFGRAHIAYIPKGKVIGVSKLARIVDVFARRMQIQERLTNQVADALIECLEPRGVAVVMEAAHLCMLMRGVQKQNSEMVTSALRGSFLSDDRTRQEFMNLVGHQMR